MWLYVYGYLLLSASFCFGFFVKGWLASHQPLDGHLVITQDDGKTQMSFEFEYEDKMVELRNKQVVSFRVVGPERITSVDDS